MGLLYEMVVKKKQSMKPKKIIPQPEQHERGSNPWAVESITIHAANERKEQKK
ncbi:hypothetical protein [Paenibacillus glycanilyticus]|uniref:Uncharacterized protein n=1 Tax=Paenibacillus glycanilyticus TaxID=126569 RepID=A0ABQ6G910_9BACL|nr:hypothetical protein [Paenibacillus glycanilyticus]GLX67434.1 hypothetical protein MU1_17790 [Paenibacillus glycanilyticus]